MQMLLHLIEVLPALGAVFSFTKLANDVWPAIAKLSLRKYCFEGTNHAAEQIRSRYMSDTRQIRIKYTSDTLRVRIRYSQDT